MTASRPSEFARNDELRTALRRAASALKAHGPAFALAGSYALWVYGAPEPVHDVDFVVADSDVDAAAATLSAAGLTITQTPEDWLFKACTDDAVVDVLYRINGVPVDAALISSSELRDVLAVRIPVLSPTEVVTQKLCTLNEHHCDFAPFLPAIRAVREQVDWERVRTSSADNDFAVAFLVLIDRLGITAGNARQASS
jgi:hypothetical protein